MLRKNLPVFILVAASSVLLIYFLAGHFSLGLTRYFDVDEYAHLHWTAQMLMGRRPYVDFLTFFPPGYWLFLSLSFIGGWGTTAPFTAARVWQFAVFAGMAASVAYLFWQVRKSWTAVLPAMILAFLPLPFDKYLEIRPDSLATLLLLLAMVFQVAWHEGKRTPVTGFLSGLFYALTVLVLPKMLPNIGIGILVFLFAACSETEGKLKTRLKNLVPILKYPVAGFVLPNIIFAVWAFSLGNPGLVIYSLTQLTVESNRISRYFIMMPDLFFYPNGIFYGQNGWSRGLFVNHAVYILGLLTGVTRLVAPAVVRGRRGMWSELLIAAQFFIQVVFYVQIVPLKHAQYLIPIGVFVAFYTADFFHFLWMQADRSAIGRSVFTVVFVLGSFWLYQVFVEVNGVKKTWTNRDSLIQMDRLYRKIPAGTPMLDLDGRFLYTKDPYYACCIPFGQFAEFLSRPLPPLVQSLDATGTRYINQGELKRVNTLPQDAQAFIYANFHEMPGEPIILER